MTADHWILLGLLAFTGFLLSLALADNDRLRRELRVVRGGRR